MKAPDITKADVIYIGEENIPYIRKDALLEWANNELENNVGQYDRDYDLAISSLIDKLNNF